MDIFLKRCATIKGFLPKMNKQELRLFLKKNRDTISYERREEAKVKIIEELYPLLKPYKKILSFASFRSEIDLWPLNQILCQEKRLLLPRVKQEELHIYYIQDLNTLTPSKMGILEPSPKSNSLCPLEDIDCALIPGLGFDYVHHRLGYGKGHIDRLLTKLSSCMTIGVGFKEQLIEEGIPFEPHDRVLKSVVLF